LQLASDLFGIGEAVVPPLLGCPTKYCCATRAQEIILKPPPPLPDNTSLPPTTRQESPSYPKAVSHTFKKWL